GYKARWHKPAGSGDKHPVAVIGAGPAGLSAGYFLARAGHPVTVFEREADAGGVVKHIIPEFRIPAELIQHDIDFVAAHGVKFEFGCDPALTVDKLHGQGFTYVFVGIGADKNGGMRLEGGHDRVYKSFNFLRSFNQGKPLPLGRHVAVIGAGNTAMDCARAALKVPGVSDVTVIYRRSEKEMPAYREEYLEAVEDGVRFCFLTNPERFDKDGKLTVRMMALGDPDEQGRRRPVPTEQTEVMQMDALITAIGEQPDCEVLKAMGIPLGSDGWPEVDSQSGETSRRNVFLIGDVQSGPSSIVGAIGGARRAADRVLSREHIADSHAEVSIQPSGKDEIYRRKGSIAVTMVDKGEREAFVAQEAHRCLEC
ncbi:MAG: FAD-dependent oxidoreductase, partial [Aeromonas sobria]